MNNEATLIPFNLINSLKSTDNPLGIALGSTWTFFIKTEAIAEKFLAQGHNKNDPPGGYNHCIPAYKTGGMNKLL